MEAGQKDLQAAQKATIDSISQCTNKRVGVGYRRHQPSNDTPTNVALSRLMEAFSATLRSARPANKRLDPTNAKRGPAARV